jgi:hypothetical protein
MRNAVLVLVALAAASSAEGAKAGSGKKGSIVVADFSLPKYAELASAQGFSATLIGATGREPGGLRTRFNNSRWQGLVMKCPADLSATDWAGFSTVVLDFENPSELDVKVSFSMRNEPETWSEGKVAYFYARVPGKSRGAWRMPIIQLRYTNGWSWPAQRPLEDITGWGRVNTRAVAEAWITIEQADRDDELVLHSLKLENPVPAEGWIDRYGQRSDVSWPDKVESDEDIKRADRREAAELKKARKVADFDEYCAWKDGPKLKATGFFRVEKVDGKWWFVAPNGRLFFATGVDCVVGGVEARFDDTVRAAHSWLPSRQGKLADAWGNGGESVNFYKVNLIRKWGEKQYWKKWRERGLARMNAWGMTSIGNWSNWRDDDVAGAKKYPWVDWGPYTWEKVDAPYVSNGIHDVFHPGFDALLKRMCEPLAKMKDDPLLIGHFVHNEVGWGGFIAGLLNNRSLPAREELLRRLKARYGNVERLNALWGTSAAAFGELSWPAKRDDENRLSAVARQDMEEFRAEFADTWYRKWAAAVRAADPNHLVLGSRLHQGNRPDDVYAACAKHMDVVSFNHYDVEPPVEEFARFAKIADKPMMVGEYGFHSFDYGLLSAAVPVANSGEAGVGYRYYTENLAVSPSCVGAHYFQYCDEPVTGRSLDRETAFHGFVSVADVPHKWLVKAARETAERLYPVRSGKLAPVDAKPRR